MEAAHEIAFVIGDAAREQLAISHVRIKRRRRPQVDGIGRLHIVVIVDQQRTGAVAQRGEEHGRTAGLDGLHVSAQMGQMDAHQIRHLGHALTGGGDAGLRDKDFEVVNEAIAVSGEVVVKTLHDGPPGLMRDE